MRVYHPRAASPILANARRVVAYLLRHPATTAAMKDDLAARCGSFDAVDKAMHRARTEGWIERGEDGVWTVTEEGRGA